MAAGSHAKADLGGLRPHPVSQAADGISQSSDKLTSKPAASSPLQWRNWKNRESTIFTTAAIALAEKQRFPTFFRSPGCCQNSSREEMEHRKRYAKTGLVIWSSWLFPCSRHYCFSQSINNYLTAQTIKDYDGWSQNEQKKKNRHLLSAHCSLLTVCCFALSGSFCWFSRASKSDFIFKRPQSTYSGVWNLHVHDPKFLSVNDVQILFCVFLFLVEIKIDARHLSLQEICVFELFIVSFYSKPENLLHLSRTYFNYWPLCKRQGDILID